jgi:hypothetical protein
MQIIEEVVAPLCAVLCQESTDECSDLMTASQKSSAVSQVLCPWLDVFDYGLDLSTARIAAACSHRETLVCNRQAMSASSASHGEGIALSPNSQPARDRR